MDASGDFLMRLCPDPSPQARALFILSAARLAGIFVTVPFFSSRIVPFRLRLGLGILLLITIATGLPSPSVPEGAMPSLSDPVGGLLLFASEFSLGVFLGWAALLALGAVRGAAVLISDQIGFSLGSVLDPLSSETEPFLRSFHAAMALSLFLTLDLHHVFLRGLKESFLVVPPGALALESLLPPLGNLLVLVGSCLFEAAFLIAFPVLMVCLVVSLTQAILARTAPELEFFLFGFPLRVFAGMGVMFLSLPFVSRLFHALFTTAFEEGRTVLQSLGG